MVKKLEVKHGSSNLEYLGIETVPRPIVLPIHVLQRQDLAGTADLDEGSKLGAIIFEQYPVPDDSDEGVAARDTDVGNLHVGVDGSAHTELVALGHLTAVVAAVAVLQIEHVHHLGRGTLDRLKDHVVTLVVWQVKLHDLKHLVLHPVFKRLLTQLALQRFPEERLNFLTFVDQALAVDPLAKAGDVDHAHRPSALAGAYQTIGLPVFTIRAFFLSAQADSADNFFPLVRAAEHGTGHGVYPLAAILLVGAEVRLKIDISFSRDTISRYKS